MKDLKSITKKSFAAYDAPDVQGLLALCADGGQGRYHPSRTTTLLPIPGATASKFTIPSWQMSDAGSYTLVASNSFGPVTSSAAVLSVASNPFLVHRWSFNDGTDSISGSNATLFGAASYSGGQLVLPGGGSHRDYATVNIAPTFAASTSLKFEGWYTDNARLNWAKA
jgi:hypothetical protein